MCGELVLCLLVCREMGGLNLGVRFTLFHKRLVGEEVICLADARFGDCQQERVFGDWSRVHTARANYSLPLLSKVSGCLCGLVEKCSSCMCSQGTYPPNFKAPQAAQPVAQPVAQPAAQPVAQPAPTSCSRLPATGSSGLPSSQFMLIPGPAYPQPVPGLLSLMEYHLKGILLSQCMVRLRSSKAIQDNILNSRLLLTPTARHRRRINPTRPAVENERHGFV